MIVKAFLAIIKAITDVVFSIIPAIPVFPSFVGDSLNWFSSFAIQGAGIFKYILGDFVYSALIDYVVLVLGFKLFLVVFNFIKKYVLMKG